MGVQMASVRRWTVFEKAFESEHVVADPFWDVDLRVRFSGPDGTTRTVDAFWDGGQTWRVRFAPDRVGPWQWGTFCSDTGDAGLHARSGTFTCVESAGSTPLTLHGPVKRSADGTHLIWADGEPFFWLADTAWNGVLRARDEDWARYLRARQDQGFSVIQFVSTEWRGARELLGDDHAFSGSEHIRLNPDFFQRRDGKVAAINTHGMVAAPVILWAVWEDDPGQALPEADAIRLGRYIVARWGAYHVVWFLGGDGIYTGARAERWHRLGQGIFDDERDRLVTMHPGGQTWVGDEFRTQDWFDFIGYQSGHGSSDEHLRWLVMGPPAEEGRRVTQRERPLPLINLEPNYENHPSYHAGADGTASVFTDHEVRRAAYWSILLAPPAGVSYGTNPIWVWPTTPEPPEGHTRLGPVAPWDTALDTPGIRSMTVLRRFFEGLSWWTLRPAPQMLAVQPGERDPRAFVAAARSMDGGTCVLYLPMGGKVSLTPDALPTLPVACWFDPRSGEWTDACALAAGDGGATEVEAPDGQDWVLVIKGGGHAGA